MSADHLTRFLLLPELKLTSFRYKSSELFYQAVKESKFEVCPHCATPSSKIHDRRQVRVKDSPEGGKARWLTITKRRFRCPKCKAVFTEPVQGIRKGARVTRKFERSVLWACEVFSDLKKVKTTYRCGYSFIYRCYYRQLELKQRERMNDPWPKTIGIDEHGLFKDKKRGAREFATIFVDYPNKRVKEVVEGKSHAELEKGVHHIKGRENVQNVVIDLSDPYKYFVKNYFPNAKIIADKFHVLRLLNPAINRRRIGITGDKRTLGVRRLLLRNGVKLSFFERSALWRWLDEHPELREVYGYKEALHKLYRCRGYSKARRALILMIDQMAESKIKEIITLRRTLQKWFNEILRYFGTRITNARTEAFNNHAKLIQRKAYGFKSFANYRLRLLNACS
jgi:transposase